MRTFLIFIITFGLMIWMIIKIYKSLGWHNGGTGERKAKAEYSRIKREEPDSDNVRLSEAEFVEQYVSAVPGMLRYVLYILLILVVGMLSTCASIFASTSFQL